MIARLSPVLLAVVAACGSTPKSTFYLLSAEDARLGDPAGPVVHVSPVALPSYLARPEIVAREAGHRLSLADFERWAEPLDESFSRALTLDLAAALPGALVVEEPWEVVDVPGREASRVSVNVLRFDVDERGVARLDARWTVERNGDAATLRVHGSALASEPVGSATAERVTALSALVDELARAIAAELGR